MTDDTQQLIEAYLTRLRNLLGKQSSGLNAEDIREIVEELRSHILDKLASSEAVTPASVKAALASLGSPEELSSQYLTDSFLAKIEVSRSPVRLLENLFRWASLSIAGFFVLVGSLFGYFLGVLFILLAILKPFYPQSAGLWASHDSTGDLELSFRLGLGRVPAGARDVFGWWIVPIGLLAGCALVFLTTRFAAWCARQYRKSRALPQH